MVREEPLQLVGDVGRAEVGQVAALEKLLEEALHGHHRQGGARAVALHVPEDVELAVFAEFGRLEQVAGHRVLRVPPDRIERRLVHAGQRRQHAALDDRREVERPLRRFALEVQKALQPAGGHDALDALDEDVRVDGLRQVEAVRVFHDAAQEPAAFLRVQRREEEDRDRRVQAAQDVAEDEAVHRVHADVGDDRAEIPDVLLFEDRDGLGRGGHADGFVAGCAELGAEHQADQPLVVHDEDFRFF